MHPVDAIGKICIRRVVRTEAEQAQIDWLVSQGWEVALDEFMEAPDGPWLPANPGRVLLLAFVGQT